MAGASSAPNTAAIGSRSPRRSWRWSLSENPERQPSVAWFKTRKGRGYLKYDNASHGVPHKDELRALLGDQARVRREVRCSIRKFRWSRLPDDAQALQAEFKRNLQTVMSVLQQRPGAGRLPGGYGWSRWVIAFPRICRRLQLGKSGNPFKDERLYDFRNYPADLYVKPGDVRRQPGSSGKMGRLGECLRRKRIRPTLVPGLPRLIWPSRPTSAALARDMAISLDTAGTSATSNPGGSITAAGDHRVCQRRDSVRHGDG